MKVEEIESIQCPVCGYYCLGHGGHGCIDKPSMVKDSEISRLQLELAEIKEIHDWHCHCDHWNGANLEHCAQCGRRPGER